MTAEQFIEQLHSVKPEWTSVSEWGSYHDMAKLWSEYTLSENTNEKLNYIVENIRKRLNTTIRLDNFQIYNDNSYGFDETFKEDGFYPFAFYAQDYLFINLKTGRIEARDLTLTKFYDVAKDEQTFLEAFLVFAKHYAYHLEHSVPGQDIPLSIPIEQRREILNEVVKLVGGKKYRLFWAQVFQAWSEQELKEMES